MRIAIISSPRCGNTFLRLCLSKLLNLETNAFHKPEDFPKKFPEKFIFQLHWEMEENLKNFLYNENFKIITLTRNPLDIFISILRFIKYEKEVEKWLDGKLELNQTIFKNYEPNDLQFINWCSSENGKKLLDVSFKWSNLRKIHSIKYENLVLNLENELNGIYKFLNIKHINYNRAVNTFKKFDINYFKSLPNKHGWKGKINNWQTYFNKKNAETIYYNHSTFFNFFKYELELDYKESEKIKLK